MIRHAGLLLALLALLAVLALRMEVIPRVIETRSALAAQPVTAGEIIAPGLLVNHDWRIKQLEDGLRDLRADHVRDLEKIQSASEWTNRLLIATLVGVIINLGQQLFGRRAQSQKKGDG